MSCNLKANFFFVCLSWALRVIIKLMVQNVVIDIPLALTLTSVSAKDGILNKSSVPHSKSGAVPMSSLLGVG